MKKITFKAVSPLVSLLWFLVVLILLFLLFEMVQTISYISERTYILISIITIILIIGYRVLKKQVKQVEFLVRVNSLEIRERKIENKKNENISILSFNRVKNYNVYYMLTKKMGYIIRIKEDKTHIYYVDWIFLSGNQKFDLETYREVKKVFDNKTPQKKKWVIIDMLLLIFASIPWIMLVLGLLCLVGIFYYVFFII